MSETTQTPVPGHLTIEGRFCSREGLLADGGRCPDGCDHANHYSNDGHPECEEPVRPHRWPSNEIIDRPRPASLDRCLECGVHRFSDDAQTSVASPCIGHR